MADKISDQALQMFTGQPPAWSITRPKPMLQKIWDFIGIPLRMVLLPDHRNEQLHLTSLRAERIGEILPRFKGRCLDIGAGDNMLIKLYKERAGKENKDAAHSIGIDVVDWDGGCLIVPDCKTLPFQDNSFDTVSFIACINHIPERSEALREAHRVLVPGGQILITMIGRFIGSIGHAVWWYSEDKHRDVHPDEMMGMDANDIIGLLNAAGFKNITRKGFLYNLNTLYIASKDE